VVIKVLPYLISAVFAYLWLTQEPEIVDMTEYYQDKRDSLEVIIEAKNRMIEIRDSRIADYINKNDSLIERENKIHRYYAREKDHANSVPDSAVLELFTRLVSNR
jgi:hypothetical protein